MASATGIPAHPILPEEIGEDEPLLGRPGDASQREGSPLFQNLIIGTAVLAQAGVLLLIASVWANVFLQPLILFSAHPLLNSTALLTIVESILILQPTHTPTQKKQGTLAHASFHSLALNLLIAGLVVIEVNKFSHGGTHFVSPHAILGLITYIVMGAQALFGLTVYFTPGVYGGAGEALALYKWHRVAGYVTLGLLLATAIAATRTDYNVTVLGINLWAMVISVVLILLGVVPRIKKQKFGFGAVPAQSDDE